MKKLYIAATGQNRGKTTLSLGLIHAFRQRGLRVGFMKPVGQRLQEVDGVRVDKDAVLVDGILSGSRLREMCSVAVERGFTEKYLYDEVGTHEQLLDRIRDSFTRAQADSDVVIVEGSGHAGVGGVFDLSNAAVAAALGLKALIVSGGGIGRPIDEIILNRALFREHGVELLGAVVNKVEASQFARIDSAVRRGLGRQGIDVLGVVPFVPLLSYLTMEHIRESIPGVLIAGADKLEVLFRNIVVGAMTPQNALDYIEAGTLVITPGDRADIVLAVVSSLAIDAQSPVPGLVLTGGLIPHASVRKLIKALQIPAYVVEDDTYKAASKITSLTVKLRPADDAKIAQIVQLIAEHVDVDRILAAI